MDSKPPTFVERIRRTSRTTTARYIIDWILVIAAIATAASLSFVNPSRHLFSLVDPAISYPYTEHEKVPTSALMCLSILFPAVVIIQSTCFRTPRHSTPTAAAESKTTNISRWSLKLHILHRALLGLGISIAIAMFVTDSLKNLTGKPRPDFLARCLPSSSSTSTSILVDSSICTTTDIKRLKDGYRAWPSGHASISFSGMTYLSLWLYSTIKRVHVLQCIVLAVPVCVSGYISSTRYADYRHAGFDVLSGIVLGVVAGYAGARWCVNGGREGILLPRHEGSEELAGDSDRERV